ncbi:hypothetical protein [Ileibacterium valens]|uniref:hypothetical protein n=1 Tax=Ileibacterium valens TaxID=1862668 RepID=UPI0023528497|nr:hypothetical protein [Ileibacterium valens]
MSNKDKDLQQKKDLEEKMADQSDDSLENDLQDEELVEEDILSEDRTLSDEFETLNQKETDEQVETDHAGENTAEIEDVLKESISETSANGEGSATDSSLDSEETETAVTEDSIRSEINDKNEIDEFAQKLLNRKTEMALWPDEPVMEKTEPVMSPEERKAAEESLSSALDELRKQRGQVPIEQEEEDFAWDHIEFKDRFEGGDNFTTQSLFLHEQPDRIISNTGRYENTSKANKEDYMEDVEKRPASKTKSFMSNAGSAVSKTFSSMTSTNDHPHKKKKKKRKLRKQAIVLICSIIGIVLLLFAGYYYKTAIYDPAHRVTAEQQAAYDKLLAYAEEYTMSSDAEKLELIKMESDYDSLSAKQKEQLNERFIANTSKSFPDLLAELKTKDGTVTTEDDPVYQGLMEYVNSYGSLDDAGKSEISNQQIAYDSLSTALKDKVNGAMQAQVGMSFTDAVQSVANGVIPATINDSSSDSNPSEEPADNTEDPNASAQDSNSVDSSAAESNTDSALQTPDNSAQLAEYQANLDEVAALRDDYISSLAEDGLSADGDEVVAEYNQEIAYWQGLINSLQ